jgi:hypothetical protein
VAICIHTQIAGKSFDYFGQNVVQWGIRTRKYEGMRTNNFLTGSIQKQEKKA